MFWISALETFGLASSQDAKRPVSFLPGWSVRFDDWSAAFCLLSETPGARLVMPDVEGPVEIHYLRTAWSGMFELYDGEQSTVLDAYADKHSLGTALLPGGQKRLISLRLLGSRNVSARAGQFWLSGFKLQTLPYWRKRHKRVTPLLDLVNADVGELLVLANDDGVSKTIRDHGVWGQAQLDVFHRFLRPGDVAVDIGANVGHHTVAMAKIVGSSGRVLAFEPQPFVYRVLMANLALNRCDQVTPSQTALGKAWGQGIMSAKPYDDPAQAWNVGGLPIVTKGARAEGSRVDIDKLDNGLRGARVDFIKSDAQGFDLFALQGARKSILKWRPTILVEIAPELTAEQGHDYRELYKLLLAHDYQLFDPETLEELKTPRLWSGKSGEEWDVLATHAKRAAKCTRL